MESASAAVSLENIEKPLNFDDYHSPSEMEVHLFFSSADTIFQLHVRA